MVLDRDPPEDRDPPAALAAVTGKRSGVAQFGQTHILVPGRPVLFAEAVATRE